MRDPFAERISAFLDGHGIHDYWFERRAKHPAVIVNHAGVTHIHCYPGSTGDYRAVLNTVSDLRRQLALTGVAAKAKSVRPKPSHPRRRRVPTAARSVVAPVELRQVEERYFSRLEALKAQLLASPPVPAAPQTEEVAVDHQTRPRRLQRLICPFLGKRARYQEVI